MYCDAIEFVNNTFVIGESYHLEATDDGYLYLVCGKKWVTYSLEQLIRMEVSQLTPKQQFGTLDLSLIKRVILSDVCRSVRTTEFVVLDSSPVFKLRHLPIEAQKYEQQCG